MSLSKSLSITPGIRNDTINYFYQIKTQIKRLKRKMLRLRIQRRNWCDSGRAHVSKGIESSRHEIPTTLPEGS